MSALIFVALAGAWAVYLVPKALKQHEDADAVRSVESFSERLRVLSSSASKVVESSQPVEPSEVVETAVEAEETAEEYVVEPVRLTPLQLRLRRAAARRAAQRRRRVLGTLVLAVLVVAGLAIAGRIPLVSIAAPVALVLAWLIACRLMVKKETATRTRVVKKRRTTLAEQALAAEDGPADSDDVEPEAPVAEVVEDGTEEIPAVGRASATTWEPVPMTLPTYVAKAPASRTVRTIDLDDTGVWSSGRNAGDSEIAREAETSRRTQREAEQKPDPRRVAGS